MVARLLPFASPKFEIDGTFVNALESYSSMPFLQARHKGVQVSYGAERMPACERLSPHDPRHQDTAAEKRIFAA